MESKSSVVTLWAIWEFSSTDTVDEEVNVGASSSMLTMETTTVWSAVLPPASVAVTITTHGLEEHVMDSKSCPDDDANRNVPELTSKSVLSVPDNV